MRIITLLVLLASSGLNAQTGFTPYPSDLLSRVRSLATSIEGDLPQSIAFAKVAESHRAYADIIEGGSEEIFVSARSAFQIRYPESTIMLDSGMDEEVHRYYGFGRTEPYFAEINERVQQALLSAEQIIITHEHGDHVAGIVRSPYFRVLAPKTLMTETQVATLTQKPQIPQIQLSTEQANALRVVEFGRVFAVAPGVVLIKSPGHTAGHQMVYVRQANNREYLFIGDIGWSMDNITEQKLRPEQTISRIGEDPEALTLQMKWIKDRMDQDGLIVVPSHDDILLKRYAEEGLLGNRLRL
jgi:glyoxylase-like metal-dependent hydrolase (beta-lactamase superfamily II)